MLSSTSLSTSLVILLPYSSLLLDTQRMDLYRLITHYAVVFQNPISLPPSRSHDHSITLTTNNPICVHPYRYPHVQKSEIERQVHELLTTGMVRKKDNSWRMCIDYRALNHVTVLDKFPIPMVDELLDELHGACFFLNWI